jgi:two-component system OmpR family response regulator
MQPLLKVLLVEDDRGTSAALSYALRNNYDIVVAASGRQALYKTDIQRYDLIVLDLNLPDLCGIDICRQLRERGVTTPILILTGEDGVMTKIKLLDAGANDYLTKPFSLGELKARLRVLTRYRPSDLPAANQLTISGIMLNRQTNQVSREGIAITLRRKEFALLECLMQHAGSVVSRDTMMRHAWETNADPWTNTIDVHIKYLRDKLDRPFATPLIQTVHGRGYRIEPR